MANVTHNGTLPDTADKADFYALIDGAPVTGIVNADCSGSMALVDTKLAQISTANKVSGTALTGLAGIPVGAGIIPAANIAPTLLGAWASKTVNTIYQATTDGFVIAYDTTTRNNASNLNFYTDSNSNPSTIRYQTSISVTGTIMVSGMCLVRKNDYWTVIGVDTAVTVWWIPLGT